MSKTAMTTYEEQLAAEAQGIKDTIAKPSSNTVSTKGKLFTLPDGKSSPGPMHVIILDYTNMYSLFPGNYDPNNPQSPICWSINKVLADMAPSANAPEPQADACVGCPKNEWGSAAVGRGKACKNGKRLMVIPVDADENTQPMTINVSPSGLKAFDAYVAKIQRDYGSVPARVITEVSFDPNQTYPTLLFKDEGLHGNLETVQALRPIAQDMMVREPESLSKAA